MQTKGIFTWFGFVLHFQDKLHMIKDAGFDTICTWWGNDFSDTDGNYRDHPEIADRAGLRIEHAHIPYYRANQIWYDTLDGESLYKRYAEDIKEAYQSGVDTLVVHPFEKLKPDTSKDHICLERFKRLGDVALKYNVKIAVENLADNQVLRRILDYSENPNIGLCFDSGHNNIIAHDDFSLLADYSDRIHALHLHDNNGSEDLHRLPFDGNLDWKRFMDAISTTEYRKSFMLESSHPFIFNENDEFELDLSIDQKAERTNAQSYLASALKACNKAIDLLERNHV